MRKRKVRKYVIGLLAVLLVSVLTPFAVKGMTNFLISQMWEEPAAGTKEGLTEKTKKDEKNVQRLLTPSEKQLQAFHHAERAEKGADEADGQKDTYEEGLKKYRLSMKPELAEREEGAVETFIGERQEQFFAAVADRLYPFYGDQLTISKIEIVERIKETGTELVYQIQLFSQMGTKEYAELFLCTYQKEWDFYSLYTQNDGEGGIYVQKEE